MSACPEVRAEASIGSRARARRILAQLLAEVGQFTDLEHCTVDLHGERINFGGASSRLTDPAIPDWLLAAAFVRQVREMRRRDARSREVHRRRAQLRLVR